MKNTAFVLLFVLCGNIALAEGDGPAFVPSYPILKIKAKDEDCEKLTASWKCKTPLAICPIGTSPVWIVDYNHNPQGDMSMVCAEMSNNLAGGDGSGS